MKNDIVMEHDALIGTTIEGRYLIKECIGEGGMGAVYVAEHLKLHKEVALKLIHPEFAEHDNAAERFAREAMVTSRFQHPNVVSAIDYGDLPEGGAYLAMELVRGRSITKILETEGCLPWARACELAAQIADALAAAKAHGIVHRDIKPENILVMNKADGSETVKVLDFGIARFDRESMAPPSTAGRRMTLQGMVLGTPGYMAPEQLVGERAGHQADLYSLGVVLWECIVGRSLWNAEDMQTLLKRQLSETPPSVRDASEDLTLPNELVGLVASLLKRRPSERPQDAAEVRDLLKLLVTSQRGSGLMRLPDTPLAERLAAMADVVQLAEEKSAIRLDATVPIEIMTPEEVTEVPKTGERPITRVSPPVPPPKKRKSRVGVLLVILVMVAAGALVYTGQLEVALKPKGDLNTIATAIAPKLVQKEEEEPAAAVEPQEPQEDEETSGTGLPEALDPHLDALVRAESRAERVESAETLLAHLPMEEVPVYVRLLAHLQLAANCARKKEQLEKLIEVPDPRALPGLVMISQRAKEGCGKPKRDCLACMRSELDGLISDLEEEVARAAATDAKEAAPSDVPAEVSAEAQ